MNNLELAVNFFLQIVVILTACRCIGFLAKKVGQPQVVAEMIAGVILGPSLFGLLAPEWQQAVFPWDSAQQARDTQSYLFPASQLGLALYMFTVGLEFRSDQLRRELSCAVSVSLAGMLAPFVFGGCLAYAFFGSRFFPDQTSLFEAVVFVGASLCITAFPMLARIIEHKKLTNSKMGMVAISAGAIDDVFAWCLLALVLAVFDDNLSQAFGTLGGAVLFVVAAFFVIRPVLEFLKRWMIGDDGKLTESGLVIGLICMASGAWFTDMIHLHAVFGAFVIGTVMPRGVVQQDLIDRIRPLTVGLLLPLFFTYSGLNTQIHLLNSASLWGIGAIVLVAAVGGKGVACWLAARICGIGNREALGIGVLMNARGLMELIIINIGLQRGIITAELHAILVLMAVVTTLMASPLFDWFIKDAEIT